jgi:hypothetical protein
MNKLKLSTNIFRQVALVSMIGSSWLIFLPSLSAWGELREREVLYENCAQLQKRMNIKNNPNNLIFKGFERVSLLSTRRSYGERFVYCNGGKIIDKEERTICIGYIAYVYAPHRGASMYFGDWGITDGRPNGDDDDKNRYCRKLK